MNCRQSSVWFWLHHVGLPYNQPSIWLQRALILQHFTTVLDELLTGWGLPIKSLPQNGHLNERVQDCLVKNFELMLKIQKRV